MNDFIDRFSPICDCKPFNRTYCSRRDCKCFELCAKFPLIQDYINNKNNLLLKEIVKKRDERLSKSKETGDYEFCVAHGLTEAIRCFPDLWDESND